VLTRIPFLMTIILATLWAGLAAGSGHPYDPDDELSQYGLRMAREICVTIASELRDRWMNYDDFQVYRINFSVGGPTEDYGCTIGATQINTGQFRETRAYIERREGSERFSYRLGQDIEVFQGCREEQMFHCVPGN